MVFILVFLSGLTALVYQVLWMKQLGLLFGNTSQAAAVTLAAFFGGLALGSWFWGKRSARMRNPLRTYAWLEFGIALTAGSYFIILAGQYALYPLMYETISSPLALLGVKLLMALLLVVPPTFFMGGTIPVIGQFLIGSANDEQQRAQRAFGTTAAALYAINTLGAAIGALLAGFYLPLWLGFRLTCIFAMTITVGVGIIAFVVSRRRDVAPTQEETPSAAAPEQHVRHRLPLAVVCFVSGFGFLALEVLWTRMFLQVLENSVYTFAAILVIVLCCLAIGGLISSRLARTKIPPIQVLAALLLASGLIVALTPFIFMGVTDEMQILATRGSWTNYVWLIFRNGALTIAPPALILGMVFPFLMKTEEQHLQSAGQSLGRLAAINTVGAILGALLCGFVMLEVFGMWRSMQLFAALYLATTLILPLGAWRDSMTTKATVALLLLFVFTWFDPTGLPQVSEDPARPYDERVLEVWETRDGTIAVTEHVPKPNEWPRGLTIRMNSHYGLGTTGAAAQERMQNDLPLMMYPNTTNVFFLGMGTGITAGGALDPKFEKIERIVVAELAPEVIAAAEKYITDYRGQDYTNGLFKDERATILAEDGRHYLMATSERFDMINGDLFVPFRSGVGNLYTREHFENVKQRLQPDGVFVQWLPLYQVTEMEFKVITRTMLEVFEQVTLWRGGFQPGDDVVALVGRRNADPLPPTDVDSTADMQRAVTGATAADLTRLALPFNSQTCLFFYCGNVTATASLFEDYPVNTDDHPIIEYLAPRSYRGQADGKHPWFTDNRLASLVDAMQKACPPSEDPMLVNRSQSDRRLPLAGGHFYAARMGLLNGNDAQVLGEWERFLEAWRR